MQVEKLAAIERLRKEMEAAMLVFQTKANELVTQKIKCAANEGALADKITQLQGKLAECEQELGWARKIVVAIDGPAGSGKSTTARLVAKKLNYVFIDTGAMYRSVALACMEKGVPLKDGAGEDAVAVAKEAVIELRPHPSKTIVFLNGKEVSDAIRTPEVTANVSAVAANAEVRAILVAKQQEMGKAGGVVMDGRDIGTVVFPGAKLKVFMLASDEARAERRFAELVLKGEKQTLEEVLSDIRKRDHADSSREASPLKQADDAVVVDTTKHTIDSQTGFILDLALARLAPATGDDDK